MSNHVALPQKFRLRRLSEACDFCGAQPGEPCVVTASNAKGKYICPDHDCNQLYERPHDTLSCTMHFEGGSKPNESG